MVHQIQARLAFGDDRNNVVFRGLVDSGDDWINLERFDGTVDRWEVGDPGRLAEIIGRDDLTRRDERPLVAGNASKRLLAFAAGPSVVPDRVAIHANIFDLSRSVLPALDPDQPEWWLIDAEVADSGRETRA